MRLKNVSPLIVSIAFLLGCSAAPPAQESAAVEQIQPKPDPEEPTHRTSQEPALVDAGGRVWLSDTHELNNGTSVVMLVLTQPMDEEAANRHSVDPTGRTAQLEVRIVNSKPSSKAICGISGYVACQDCALKDANEIPSRLDCTFARNEPKYAKPFFINLSEKGDALELTFEGTPMLQATVPMSYSVRRVSPFEVAFGVMGWKTTGNRSSETDHLSAFADPMNKRAAEVGAKAKEVDAMIRSFGVDPSTIPFDLAQEIREEVQEVNREDMFARAKGIKGLKEEKLPQVIRYALLDANIITAKE